MRQSLVRVRMAAKKISAEFCLGDPAFCSCKKNIYQLLCGILYFMRKQDAFAPNFLDQKDGRFRELQGTCESVFWQLRQSGIGVNPKKAAVISKSEENHLWASGILGCSSPTALQRTVFFYLGKNFCLRGGEEQQELKPSQLIRKRNPGQNVYVETGSKNRSGGLKEMNVDNKVVPIYACPAAGKRCLVWFTPKQTAIYCVWEGCALLEAKKWHSQEFKGAMVPLPACREA